MHRTSTAQHRLSSNCRTVCCLRWAWPRWPPHKMVATTRRREESRHCLLGSKVSGHGVSRHDRSRLMKGTCDSCRCPQQQCFQGKPRAGIGHPRPTCAYGTSVHVQAWRVRRASRYCVCGLATCCHAVALTRVSMQRLSFIVRCMYC